jgi:putative chitinase
MTVTINQLYNIMPSGGSKIDKYVDPLNAAMLEFDINTPARQAAFIAQIAHESGQFSHIQENLNYSASGLLKTFGKYFNAKTAQQYARAPQSIANRVYANRMGNGDFASGDGWKYRGRGLIQLTGRANYYACGKGLGIDLLSNPDALLDPAIACRSAAWFWKTNGLNELADAGKFETITRRINGGTKGLEERKFFYERAKKYLKV